MDDLGGKTTVFGNNHMFILWTSLASCIQAVTPSNICFETENCKDMVRRDVLPWETHVAFILEGLFHPYVGGV